MHSGNVDSENPEEYSTGARSVEPGEENPLHSHNLTRNDGEERVDERRGRTAYRNAENLPQHHGLDLESTVDGEILPSESMGELSRAIAYSAQYSGPLPSSSEFAGYEQVLIGAADRILKMAETSISVQETAVQADADVTHAVADGIRASTKRDNRQQIFSFFITFSVLVITVIFVIFGFEVPAIFAFCVFLASGYYTAKRTAVEKFAIPGQEMEAITKDIR
ncbi:MAG: hypothetical protein Q4A31_09370 [Corynebacterium sp.]|uniref:DUF2335 domain-containing protein n=1 Tax=Corynebacterium sp. TaxID=1720 RepID=UPI0026DC5E08|nr:DUF2335 domain-containing protein [Corynebacterium sp.]MDO4762114.1 hypothetical protein [Corynebacterium sp.]